MLRNDSYKMDIDLHTFGGYEIYRTINIVLDEIIKSTRQNHTNLLTLNKSGYANTSPNDIKLPYLVPKYD